jgi:hypothetical protein
VVEVEGTGANFDTVNMASSGKEAERESEDG